MPGIVAGALFITDGRVHDVPAEAAQLGFNAPVHALITGRPGERDRRIQLITAPRFGIVGQSQTVVLRVEDPMDNHEQPVGKQWRWYTTTSGIWQTVYVEPRSPAQTEGADAPHGGAHSRSQPGPVQSIR